jgi:phosphoenolpyruvate carboxykinase (ATP)
MHQQQQQDFEQHLKEQLTPYHTNNARRRSIELTQALKFIDTEFHDPLENELQSYGIEAKTIFRNAPVPILYEQALRCEQGSQLTSTGALSVRSGVKTGRSPADKRIVEDADTKRDVWWGPVNIKLSQHSFMINRERAIDYLNTKDHLFIEDGYAGWDPEHRIKIRVITTRAYHALFMKNMMIRPTEQELAEFGKPDYVIYNAGSFPANRYTEGMTSSTSVSINFASGEFVILGTQYAGEMKKGIFTIMHYLMPKQGLLSLHSSCNLGKDGDVSLFFGLSGTGKTTLSADPNRYLIGDDEHVWSDKGVFNIEGGCYAKAIGLKKESEPEIFDAIRFGAVVENVVLDERQEIEFDDQSITENTRVSYPLEYIPNAKIPAMVDTHPTNLILLTCDSFGVLPPVSKLTDYQAMYHFISGFTSKVAGTEVGVTSPEATFSSCYGSPFLVWHPVVYANMLAEKMRKHKVNAWLVNTGWVGGYETGKRCPLKYTRKIIDAIHDGSLEKAETAVMPVFGLHIPTKCDGVPSDLLLPWKSWTDAAKYDETVQNLAERFIKNFRQYEEKASQEVLNAGPTLLSVS